GFALTRENAPFVAEICARVDGIPLAIELAAARVPSLSLRDIADRLSDRFRLLVGSRYSGPARHQTLLRTLDWSHELLPPSERAVFRRLSVFRGGTSLAGAERVCMWGETGSQECSDVLARLVDKSVIRAEVSTTQTRYRFLESVREYA